MFTVVILSNTLVRTPFVGIHRSPLSKLKWQRYATRTLRSRRWSSSIFGGRLQLVLGEKQLRSIHILDRIMLDPISLDHWTDHSTWSWDHLFGSYIHLCIILIHFGSHCTRWPQRQNFPRLKRLDDQMLEAQKESNVVMIPIVGLFFSCDFPLRIDECKYEHLSYDGSIVHTEVMMANFALICRNQ